MDIEEINSHLQKINDCVKYIVIELNKDDNRNNNFYDKYEEQLQIIFSETLLKLIVILNEVYLTNLNEIKSFIR